LKQGEKVISSDYSELKKYEMLDIQK